MLFMRELIARALNSAFPDAKTDTAINGADAKRKIELSPYDLILCDWEMPDIKGNELLIWLREHPIFHKTPFIMVTARSDKDCIMEAIKLGVDDYIVKPLSIDMLSRKIKALFSDKDKATQPSTAL